MAPAPAFAQKKPNVVMLMTDDTAGLTLVATSAARPSGTRRRTSIDEEQRPRRPALFLMARRRPRDDRSASMNALERITDLKSASS